MNVEDLVALFHEGNQTHDFEIAYAERVRVVRHIGVVSIALPHLMTHERQPQHESQALEGRVSDTNGVDVRIHLEGNLSGAGLFVCSIAQAPTVDALIPIGKLPLPLAHGRVVDANRGCGTRPGGVWSDDVDGDREPEEHKHMNESRHAPQTRECNAADQYAVPRSASKNDASRAARSLRKIRRSESLRSPVRMSRRHKSRSRRSPRNCARKSTNP